MSATWELDRANAWTERSTEDARRWNLTRHRDPLGGVVQQQELLAELRNGRLPAEPAFEYVPVEASVLDEVERFADEAHATLTDPLGRLVAVGARRTAQQVAAYRSRTPEDVTALGLAMYGAPDDALIADARRVLAADAAASGPASVDAAEAVATIREVLDTVGLGEWDVVLDDGMVAGMSVNARRTLVRVRAGATFTPSAVRGLIVHEVGTHVYRAANGALQPLAMLTLGTPGYDETEEGIATWHELQVVDDVQRIRTFALRVLAADEALRSGFNAVLTLLLDHGADPELALGIAIRAKRGMHDSSASGSSLKDVIYLRGLRGVDAALAADPSAHDLLMSGKAGVADLPLLRELRAAGLLVAPVHDVRALISGA